jgi:hypothetical protein
MKTFPTPRGIVACALVLGCVAPRLVSAESSRAPAPSRTEIVFDSPDSYSDWELSDGADWYRDEVFTALRSYVAKQAEAVLPEGYSLKVTFTDIDFGHRSSRKVPATPGTPSFAFNFAVADASGKVVRQGSESLRFFVDFGNYRTSIETTDLSTQVIQREKPMLKSWAYEKLAGLKQD